MPFCPNCRDEFEDWVKICPDCRAKLVNDLPPLPKIPFPSPVLKDIYQKIIHFTWLPPEVIKTLRKTYENFAKCNWLHHTIVVVITMIILALSMTFQPWGNLSNEELTELNTNIRSCQMDVFNRDADGTEEQLIGLSWVYPYSYHGTFLPDNDGLEFVVIDSKYFVKDVSPDQLVYDIRFHIAKSQLRYIFEKNKNELLDLLIEIQELPDEMINGTDCFHHKAKLNTNPQVDLMIAELKAAQSDSPEFYTDDYVETELYILEQYRTAVILIECWMSKESGILNQLIITEKELSVGNRVLMNDSCTRTIYYNVNHPAVINPPENLFGNLLHGWSLFEFGVNRE